VHPSHYPFVLNGPLCACGHRRLSHVGTHPRYAVPAFDLGCSGCELCESYTPMEAIDHEAESLQRDQIREAEAGRTKIHRRVTSITLAGVVFMVPMVAWKPELFPGMIVPIVGLGVGNMSVAAIDRWRRGDLERVDALIEAGLSVSVIAFVIALVLSATPMLTLAVLVVVLAFGFAFALRAGSDAKRSKGTFDAMLTDLHDRLGDDDK
jgi:ferredoxin